MGSLIKRIPSFHNGLRASPVPSDVIAGCLGIAFVTLWLPWMPTTWEWGGYDAITSDSVMIKAGVAAPLVVLTTVMLIWVLLSNRGPSSEFPVARAWLSVTLLSTLALTGGFIYQLGRVNSDLSYPSPERWHLYPTFWIFMASVGCAFLISCLPSGWKTLPRAIRHAPEYPVVLIVFSMLVPISIGLMAIFGQRLMDGELVLRYFLVAISAPPLLAILARSIFLKTTSRPGIVVSARILLAANILALIVWIPIPWLNDFISGRNRQDAISGSIWLLAWEALVFVLAGAAPKATKEYVSWYVPASRPRAASSSNWWFDTEQERLAQATDDESFRTERSVEWIAPSDKY